MAPLQLTKRMACAVLVLMWVLGCSAGASPLRTLDDYAAAVRSGDVDRAYALLSEDARLRISRSAFERMLRDDPTGAQRLADGLAAPASGMDVSAQAVTRDGDVVELRYEQGEWKLDLSAVDLYSQATPSRAVAAFVRAFDKRRYDVLLRFVPEADRGDLTAERLRAQWEGEQRQQMSELIEGLRLAGSSAPVEVVGNRATIQYGAGAAVHLLNESGVWKIEGF